MRAVIKAITAVALVCGLFSVPEAASAQETAVSVEVRGGYNLPVGEFKDGNAESSAGFGADFMVGFTEVLSAYAGWGRDLFDCEGCIGDDDIHSQGFEAGLKFLLIREGAILPWVRAGGIYHELSGDISEVKFESDSGFGYQASAGVDIPLTESFSLSPAVRFQSWTADVEFDTPIDGFLPAGPEHGVRYLSFDVAAHLTIR